MGGITKAKVGIGLGIAALVLITLTAGLEFPFERQFRVTLQQTYVMVVVMDVLFDLEEAEAHEHGYLLAGEASDLKHIDTLRKAYDELDRLRDLARRNPGKQQQIEQLQFLIHRELK